MTVVTGDVVVGPAAGESWMLVISVLPACGVGEIRGWLTCCAVDRGSCCWCPTVAIFVVSCRRPGCNLRQNFQHILPYRLAQPLLPELIERKAKRRSPTRRRVRRDGWLSPLSLAQDSLSTDPRVHSEGYRASDKGFLSMAWEDSWALLRWTAKQTVGRCGTSWEALASRPASGGGLFRQRLSNLPDPNPVFRKR